MHVYLSSLAVEGLVGPDFFITKNNTIRLHSR